MTPVDPAGAHVAAFLIDALAIPATLAVFAVGANLFRRRLVREPATLEPNCLLTKHPVEFWTGPRTPFYFMNYWNGLPAFLHAHGYDVSVVRFPWRGKSMRRIMAEQKLLRGRRHVVVDESAAAEFADLFRLFPPASLIVARGNGPVADADGFAYRLHRWCLKLSGWSHPVAGAADLALGPNGGLELKSAILHALRDVAENDWNEGPERLIERRFTLESFPPA